MERGRRTRRKEAACEDQVEERSSSNNHLAFSTVKYQEKEKAQESRRHIEASLKLGQLKGLQFSKFKIHIAKK